MIDLTPALCAIPAADLQFFEAIQPPAWTDAKILELLPRLGIKSTPRNGKHDFAECPFCHETEGNPAVWIKNGVPIFKCHRANKCGQKTFADLQALSSHPKLRLINALDLPEKYPHVRPQVVKGLIRRGDVCNVIGGPKARKSFLVMLLALCVASGRRFLAWETVQGRVLLIDNELRGDDLARRMMAMAEAMGLRWEEVAQHIDIMPLRGTLADLNAICGELCNLPSDTYSLVIVDALYKALPAGTDENSNSDMTRAYVLLDASAEKHNCATTVVHHTSKGNQREKSVSDMGSGAGAQSRSAGAHIVLREHEDKDTVVLQAIVRSQKPVDPICLVFEYPLWRVAPDKDPANTAMSNKKPTPTLDDFLATLPTEPGAKSDVLAWSKTKLGCSKDTIKALVQEAKSRGLVEIAAPANKTLAHTIRKLKAS